MKKSILLGGVVFTFFAYFASFVGTANAGDATITLDDNAGSSSFVVQDSDKTNQFKVNSDGNGYFAGNVGIGTTPVTSQKLYIVNESTNSPLYMTRTGARSWISFQFNDGYEATAVPLLDMATGSNSSDRRTLIMQRSTGISINDVSGNSDFMVSSHTALGDRFIVKSSGNVGIGTTSPSEKLEVSGNIKASGTISQGSSRDFKKNIAYVSTKDAMKTLNGLNPVRFEYKTDNSGEEHLGFIAEDVPDLVAEQDRKHLNSMDITAVLTKVVQEQQRQIQEQQKVISTLLSRVKEIEGKI